MLGGAGQDGEAQGGGFAQEAGRGLGLQAVGDEGRGAAVGRGGAQGFVGGGIVDRGEDGIGLEGGEDADDELEAVHHVEQHAVAGIQAAGAEGVGQAAGHLVELAVGQAAAFADEGGLVGMRGRAPTQDVLEEADRPLGKRGGGWGPRHESLLPAPMTRNLSGKAG